MRGAPKGLRGPIRGHGRGHGHAPHGEAVYAGKSEKSVRDMPPNPFLEPRAKKGLK